MKSFNRVGNREGCFLPNTFGMLIETNGEFRCSKT